MDERSELRQQISRTLAERAVTIANDAIAICGDPVGDTPDTSSSRIIELIVQGLVIVTRDGEVDSRGPDITDLRRLALDGAVPIRQLFDLVYVVERTALDELALDESWGATSEPWPLVAQLVRRASFALLAAFADRLGQESGDESLIDPLTTLYTRAVLLAAMDKEILRAERSGHPFALIVFDVDRLDDINVRHGYGFGDRLLERIGIVIRQYFREQDWVARSSGDSFGVLLPETPRAHAEQLADRVRETLQDRMSLRDYRSDEPVLVTVSVAVVAAESVDSTVRGEHLLRQAEHAVHRAKHEGRNRVERVEINVKGLTLPSRDVKTM